MHRILDRLSGRPYLLLTLTMLMWGGNAAAGRLAVGEVSPMALTGLRWVVPVAVLGVALRYQLLTHRQALLERWPSILLPSTRSCMRYASSTERPWAEAASPSRSHPRAGPTPCQPCSRRRRSSAFSRRCPASSRELP